MNKMDEAIKVLERAQIILKEGKKDYSTLSVNGELISMDEREVDGAIYDFDLGEGYVLEIKTSNFSIDYFTITHKK